MITELNQYNESTSNLQNARFAIESLVKSELINLGSEVMKGGKKKGETSRFKSVVPITNHRKRQLKPKIATVKQ